MSYQYYNANAKNNFIDDCVIRSISVAEGKSWDETYEELSILARKEGLLFSSVPFVEDYLDSKYNRTCCKSTKVGDFVRNHPYGIYLITMDGHITCSYYGTIVDTFDCSNRIMKCAWKVSR